MKNKKFKVEIESTISYVFEVEAENKEAAIRTVQKKLEIEEARQLEDNYYRSNITDNWWNQEGSAEEVYENPKEEPIQITKTANYCYFIECPHCGFEEHVPDEAPLYGEIYNAIEENRVYAHTCQNEECEQVININSSKTY